MPIQYAGGNISATFTANVRSDIQANIAAQLTGTPGWTKVALGTGQGVGNVGTVTITIDSPAVVNFPSHGFLGGERVILQTTGALPTGLSANTVYFVKFIDTNNFNLSTSLGGANINTSGTQSGTHTLNTESMVLQTRATPQGLAIQVVLRDNRANCIQVSIQNTALTLVGGNTANNGGNLLPAAGKVFRIIANPYQFFVFVPGVFSLARNFVTAGVPYIPPPLTVPACAGWMLCDSIADSSGQVPSNWRTGGLNIGTNTANMQLMYGLSFWEIDIDTNPGGSSGTPSLVCLLTSTVQNIGGAGNLYRWANGDIITSDALLAWGLNGPADEGQIRGQLWDALVIHDSFPGDTTTSFDSHNWWGLQNNNLGSGGPRGTLFLVTP